VPGSIAGALSGMGELSPQSSFEMARLGVCRPACAPAPEEPAAGIQRTCFGRGCRGCRREGAVPLTRWRNRPRRREFRDFRRVARRVAGQRDRRRRHRDVARNACAFEFPRGGFWLESSVGQSPFGLRLRKLVVGRFWCRGWTWSAAASMRRSDWRARSLWEMSMSTGQRFGPTAPVSIGQPTGGGRRSYIQPSPR
jgi:hypothetical protein